jgi:hypothetical protein
MNKYKVKVIYKYSDTVEVEAKNPEDAIKAANLIADEDFESFYDAEVEEINP